MFTTPANKRTLSRRKERVVSDFNDLVASTEDLLRTTASYGGAEIEAARSKLQNQLNMARGRATQWQQLGLDKYTRASEVTDQYVHTNTWKALGIAAVVGLVIGCCISPDRDDR